MNPALYSSATGEWSTPQDFFDDVDSAFHFTVDAAASSENHKCPSYWDKALDGLHQDWRGTEGMIWCNPPYGRGIGEWLEKGPYTDSIFLVPARTDTRWFKEAFEWAAELYLIAGRLKFGGAENSAPFPSCMFRFTKKYAPSTRVSYWRPNGAADTALARSMEVPDAEA